VGKGKFRKTMGNEGICCNWGIDKGILVLFCDVFVIVRRDSCCQM
jgi:hypothetical protein